MHTDTYTHTAATFLTCFLCVFLSDRWCRARKCAVSSGLIASLWAGRCLGHEISHVTDTAGYEFVFPGFLQLSYNFIMCFVTFFKSSQRCNMEQKCFVSDFQREDRSQLFTVMFRVSISVRDGEPKSPKNYK